MNHAAKFTARTNNTVGIGKAFAVLRRVGAQDSRNALSIAATIEIERLGRMYVHLVFVEQAPQQPAALAISEQDREIARRLVREALGSSDP